MRRRLVGILVLVCTLAGGGGTSNAPSLGELVSLPHEGRFTVRVGDQVDFAATVDGAVGYQWTVGKKAVSHDPAWSWTPTVADVGERVVRVAVAGEHEPATRAWHVVVSGLPTPELVNVAPAPGPLTLAANTAATFHCRARVPAGRDSDKLQFSWMLDGRAVHTEEHGGAEAASEFPLATAEPGHYNLMLRVRANGRAVKTVTWRVAVEASGLPKGAVTVAAGEEFDANGPPPEDGEPMVPTLARTRPRPLPEQVAELPTPAGGGDTIVRSVDVERNPDPVVHLRLSAPAGAQARTLPARDGAPHRVYIDLPHTRLPQGGVPVTPGAGPILRVRTGQFDATTARVVLDLAVPVPFSLRYEKDGVAVVLQPAHEVEVEAPHEPTSMRLAQLPHPATPAAPAVPPPAPAPPAATPPVVAHPEPVETTPPPAVAAAPAVNAPTPPPVVATPSPEVVPAPARTAPAQEEPVVVASAPPPPVVAAPAPPEPQPAQTPAADAAPAPPANEAAATEPPPAVAAAPTPEPPASVPVASEPAPAAPAAVEPPVEIAAAPPSPPLAPSASAPPVAQQAPPPFEPVPPPVALARVDHTGAATSAAPPAPASAAVSETPTPSPMNDRPTEAASSEAPVATASSPAPPTPPDAVPTAAPIPPATDVAATPPPEAAPAKPTELASAKPSSPVAPAVRPAPHPPHAALPSQVLNGFNLPLVVIDAGHGGRDPGAEGVGGVREKDVVLEVARRLATVLTTRFPVSVMMTRTDDSFVPIDGRLAMTGDDAVLFLSLHANACTDPSPRGFEVFYGGGRLRTASTRSQDPRAALLGRCLHQALGAFGIVRHDPQPGSWGVLARNHVPSALVEIGYLTHPEEAVRTQDAAYQERLAGALADGVGAFLRASAPPL